MHKFDKETMMKCLNDIFFLERLPQSDISYTYKNGQWYWSTETRIKLLELMRESETYYTPSIEELYIGYELEFLEDHGSPNEKWVPKKIMYISDGEDCPYKGNTMAALQHYDNVFIRLAWRVPYLTGEQLEAEGWWPADYTDEDKGMRCTRKYKPGYSSDYCNILITHLVDNPTDIVIKNLKRLGNYNYKSDILYKGECKSINEFRTILKLLNIKK